jgi:hypothetical protein
LAQNKYNNIVSQVGYYLSDMDIPAITGQYLSDVLESPSTRLLTSATPKEREKFIIELDVHYESQNLYERLQRLWNVNPPEWDDTHTYEFNKCDEQHIIGMISAEKKSARSKRFRGHRHTARRWKIKHSGKSRSPFVAYKPSRT